MDETDFANMDDLNVRTQSSPNVYTILEAQKRNDFKIPRKSHDDKYLKKSTVFFIIFLCINVAILCSFGCGVLVYVISSRSTESKLILPSNIAISDEQVQSPKTTPGTVQHEGPMDISIINQGCRGDWMTNGESCYLFSNESVTWLTAMVRCQNQGGYLTAINSATEDEFLRQQAKQIKNTGIKEVFPYQFSQQLHTIATRYWVSSIKLRTLWCQRLSDCYRNKSSEYHGFKRTTYDGHMCQRWDSQTPHIHTRNKPETFPDNTLADASNYCRDPDGEGFPWCYTTDPKIRWQHCGLYSCRGGDFWTGLVMLEGKWKWMNEKQGDTHFTHWAEGKPTKGMCGYVVGTLNFAWDAQSCEFPAMYICEKSSSTRYPS